MGQRLVVTVKKNDQKIAGIYYHWSAYSVSALQEAQDIVDCLCDEYNPIKDLRLRLIRFIEGKGGCIDGGAESKEFERIQDVYPTEVFNDNGSRNNGLIALTEEGIQDLEDWSEGDVIIDLDNELIYNTVFCCLDIDEYWKLEDMIEYDIEIENIPFENLSDTIDKLEKAPYVFRQGETIYELIA